MTTDPLPPDFDGTVRLFPLPTLVMFPGVVQGLHIFEPRYRQMTADALATDQLIAMVLLKPDWEEQYDAAPPIEPVACVGRIGWSEALADGRFNLRLRGLCRVRILDEVPTDRLYRTARVGRVVETAPTDLAELRALRQALAEVVVPRFEANAAAHKQVEELFAGEAPLGQVCDLLAFTMPLDLPVRQALLAEADAGRRAAALTEALRPFAGTGGRAFPPKFSPN